MKKFAKKIGLSLAALACVACAGVGVAINTSNSTEAYAAEIPASDFYVSGAGIRLVNDYHGRGLRFHTIVTTDVYNNTVKNAKETGTLIIPAFRCDGELTLDDMKNESKNQPVKIVTYSSTTGTDLWYDYTLGEEAVKRSTTYVYNIPEEFNGARFIAVSYVTDAAGNTTYTGVSPEKSMADVANSVSNSPALTEMQKEQVETYKVNNVAVKFVLPDGSTETQTVAYGSKVTAPTYTYDENVYTLVSTDQYGNAIDLNTYEATMPATITMTLVGKDSEKPWLPTTATSVANYIWRNESFVGGGDAVKADYTDEIAAPAGFSKVSKYPWTQSQTDFTTGFFNYTLNISNYSHLYFAMKISDPAKAYIYIQGMGTGYEGGDWLYVHMYQAEDGKWSKDYYSADGEFTHLGKHTGITSSDNRFSNMMLYQSGVNRGSHPKKYTASDAVDVYATEILGVLKDNVNAEGPVTPSTPNVSADAEVIATSASSYAWGTRDLWEDSAMAAPVGYNNVKEYDWMDQRSANASYKAKTEEYTGVLYNAETDISGYSDLYFAMKMVGGKGIYMQGAGWYNGGDWLYFHYTQKDGKWSLSVAVAAGAFEKENCQTELSATTLKGLLAYKSYPVRNNTEEEVKIYVTEIKGVPTAGKTTVWGEKVLNSPLDNSAPSKAIFGGTAAFTKLEFKKGFAATDFAAVTLKGYTELRFAMLSTSNLVLNDTAKTWVEGNESGNYSVSIDNTTSNTPALYLVTLTKTERGWHVNFGGTTAYNNGGWVKKAGFEYDSTGNSLSEILNIFNANNNATIYVTEVRGIKCTEHTGGTATCQELAVCTRCGASYGEFGDHTGAATCTQDGICTVCGVKFLDAHGHSLSVAAGETGTCSICGESMLNTGIPTYAVNVMDHIWKTTVFNGTSETTYTNGNENYVTKYSEVAAPAGFSKVTETSWTPDGANNPYSSFMAITANQLNAMGLTVYSDVYLAMRAGDNMKIDFSKNVFYTGGAWLYIHAHQTSDKAWTIKYYTSDSTTSPVTEKSVTGMSNLIGLLYYSTTCLPRYKDNNVDMSTAEAGITYITNVVAVPKCNGTHVAVGVKDNGDGTHSTVCSCGEVLATENCTPYGEPTCTEASRCAVCGSVCEAALGHNIGVATCTKKATCSRCGLEAGELAPHDLTYTSGSYIATCNNCGANVFDPAIPTNATTVANYIWRNESFTGGGDAVKAEYTDEIAAPAGFSKVSKYPFSQEQQDFPTGFLNYRLNISNYSHLYFAMKISDPAKAYIYIQGMATGYEGGDWLYVHMYQAEGGKWSKDYYSADGEFTYLGKQTGITSSDNQFRNMMLYQSGVNRGSHPKKVTASDAVDVYATEILAVAKCDGTNHTATFYTSNGNGTHKVTCGCGTVINESASCSGGTASCASKAVCTYCHVGYGEKSGEHTLGTAANCGHGNICSVCGAEYTEPVGEHTGGTATCQEQAKCAVCGQSYGTLGAHTGGVATCTAAGTCTVCHEEYLPALGHTGGTATCQVLAECTRCGASYGELAAHTPEWVDEKYVCSVCGEVCDAPKTALEKQTYSLFTNASYANGFRANKETQMTVDLSGATSLEMALNSVTVNGKQHTASLNGTTLTVNVLPNAVFGDCDVVVNVTIAGQSISISVPMLVITNTINTQAGFVANRTVLRGADKTTADSDGSIGGTGGDDTMNGDGYYVLGDWVYLPSNTAMVWGTSKVPFVGTFDGNGYKLHNLSQNSWFDSNQQDTTSAYAAYLEASVFGVVNGVVKNVYFTNVQQYIYGNIVHSGSGTIQDVYIQIANLQASASVYVPLLFARGDLGAGIVENVVIDVTDATMTYSDQASVGTWWPSFVKGATLKNVAVYGFNSATMSGISKWNEAGGFLYTPGNVANMFGNNGARDGMYAEYVGGATTGWKVVKAAFNDTFWKIVDGMPKPIKALEETEIESAVTPSEVGNLGYNLVWDDTSIAAYDAVRFIYDTTKRKFDAKEYGSAAFNDTDLSTNQLVIGDYTKYSKYLSDTEKAAINDRAYGVYKYSNTIFVLSNSREGLLFAAKEYCRQMFGWNQFTFGEYSEGAYGFDANITEFEVNKIKNYYSEITFTSRNFVNGNNTYMSNGTATSYTKSDFGFSDAMPFTYYNGMHNALSYFSGYSDTNYKATSSNGEATYNQVCYFAHGVKTSFENMVAHVGGIIKAQKVKAINFMLEDNTDYCQCPTCAQFSNPSVGQTIFLNALANWLDSNGAADVVVEFFSYNAYSPAPVLSASEVEKLTTLAGKLGLDASLYQMEDNSTYADESKTTVLKTNDGLRLWWTSHEANHSFPLEHEANAHMYKALQAWIASIGASKIDVFMYQANYRDYFIPLNTWQYQVLWYKKLHELGLGGHIYNLGNFDNPVGAQTGFSAFKTYIDSRMMTDYKATYEEIKAEFFGENGYYGAGGPTMETYFNELVAVYEWYKQGNPDGEFVDTELEGYVATMTIDNPSTEQIRQGFFNGSYQYNHLAMLNGMYSKSGTSYIYTPGEMFKHSKYDSQAATLEAWYGYCKTALDMVDPGSVYATRIKAEAILPEYLYLMFQSIYKGSTSSSEPTVTMTVPTTGSTVFTDNYANSKTWYQNLYADCVALGMVYPSEFYGFGEPGGTLAYYNSIDSSRYIYGNMWKNWGVDATGAAKKQS